MFRQYAGYRRDIPYLLVSVSLREVLSHFDFIAGAVSLC